MPHRCGLVTNESARRLIVEKPQITTNMKLYRNLRIGITTVVTLLVWGHILWDHFHGGIPTHYLLHDKDMPGIPNWWGGIALPIFTWFLLYRVHKRIETPHNKESLKTSVWRFFGGFLFAVTISICFVHGIEVTDYIMGLIFILAFIFPLYKSEYLLGWVLGASYTFGAIIPILFGSILALLFFIFYKGTRAIVKVFKLKKTV
ncbi:MAG: hypothetical protein CMH48_12795 [Muricauda sp.]|nr:hypothetical protein [Allomuricauda sp.]